MQTKRTFAVLLAASLSTVAAQGQDLYPSRPELNQARTAGAAQPPSNSVSHMAVRGKDLWIGTSKGAAVSSDGGRTWQSFRSVAEFARPGIFALAVRQDTVWCATGFTQELQDQDVQTGSGFTFSRNYGASWTQRPQPLDAQADTVVQYGINAVKFLPIVVDEQNVTFDVSLASGTVWMAGWSSGIRKSTDNGQTWQRIVLPSEAMSSISPADTLTGYKIDPRLDNNFLGFAVFAQSDSVIWAGTAGGINKSTDGGSSWTKFTTSNQASPILGDWIITITAQQFGATTRIWTTNWPAEGANQHYGVSFSDDGGMTWQNVLYGIKAYDFAFRDSVAYVATVDGLYRTSDGGNSWIRSGSVVDYASGARLTTSVFYAVGVIGDTVYAGGPDGVVRTTDDGTSLFGSSWKIIRTAVPLSSASATYAYPNPFSPRTENTRIRYRTPASPAGVTVEIFDFGMERVRTVIRDASRAASSEYDEIWDGLTDAGTAVANGVYFYRVMMADEATVWGKILVLR